LEGFAKRKWVAITLAAVILPMSLLTTFKLTGIIPESQTPEIITVDAVNWNMTRSLHPGGIYDIGETVENIYATNEVAVMLRVDVCSYVDDPDPVVGPYFGRDGVCFTLSANFSIPKGFGVSLVVKYLPADDNATVYVQTSNWAVIKENISVTGIKWFGTSENEAYTKAEILNSPCCLDTQAYWVFDDQNTIDHTLNVALEATYFNGTTYQKIVLPVALHIFPDAGNTINDPNVRSIGCGSYKACLCPIYDTSDFYKILVHESGKMVDVHMKPPSDADYDLYYYDRNKNEQAHSTNRGNGIMEWLAYPSDPLGDCYIEVRFYANCSGKYELEVTTYYGGGCPFLYAWNGQDYVIDNNLLPTSARSSGTDVRSSASESTIFILFFPNPREFQEKKSQENFDNIWFPEKRTE